MIELNEQAFRTLTCKKQLKIIEGATHLFEEEGALEQVAGIASEWFLTHLKGKITGLKPVVVVKG